MKKKILLIFDFESNGGTKTYFYNLVNFIEKSNYDIEIIIKKKSSLTELEIIQLRRKHKIIFFPNFYKQDNLNQHPFFFIFYRFIFCFKYAFKYNKIIVSTGNYFHFFNFAILNNKFIYILHTYPILYSNKKIVFLLRQLYFYFLNFFNFKIITVSNFSKKKILAYTNFNETKVKVIYNYVDFKLPNTKKTFDRNIILTVGHVEEWKNPNYWLNVAITICEKRNDITFIWVGSGSLIFEMINKTPKCYLNNIKWVGNSNNVKEFYLHSTIYFQPSKIESFGISVLEAMSFGLPCVVSSEGGLIEIVRDNSNGYIIDINNIENSISKLELLIDNKFKREEFSLNSIQYQKEFFSIYIWEKQMSINIYD